MAALWKQLESEKRHPNVENQDNHISEGELKARQMTNYKRKTGNGPKDNKHKVMTHCSQYKSNTLETKNK